MKIYCVFMSVLLPCLLSCTSAQKYQQESGNKQQTDADRVTHRWKVCEKIKKYEHWKTCEFKYIGLRVDIPTEARTSPSAKRKPDLSITFHYIYHPFWVPLDPIVFVEIYIERIPLKKLEEELESTKRSNLFKNSSEEKNKYWFWRFTFQEKTSRWDEPGQYSYYRRDIKINDTEILHAYAEVLNTGFEGNIRADHAAVRRILDSIEPLPEQ